MILGKPLIMYLGIIVLVLFLIAAYIGTRVLRGKAKLETHKTMVAVAIIVAIIHAILGVLSFF